MSAGGWIQTVNGNVFFPLKPSEHDVAIEDIAHALAMKCRYSGHTAKFYSVAEHSVHVSRHVPAEHALWGLLHDASEAYLPDVARPIKAALVGFAEVERRVTIAVSKRFGLAPHWPEPIEVKQADTAILHDEKAALLPHDPMPWNLPGSGLGVKIRCWDPVEGKLQFLKRFNELYASGTVS